MPHFTALGEEIAETTGMIGRKTDKRPGPLPDIRPDNDSIVYSLEIPGEQARLIIRCDPGGNVTASLAPIQPPQ